MVGANVILTGCKPEDRIEGLDFSPEDISFMDEIGETIIPTTDTPGAKDAGVGSFMEVMVRETYNQDQQETFVNGLNSLRRNFRSDVGVDFMDASLEQRTEYLNRLRVEARDAVDDKEGPQYIKMLKDLTVLGYFTSEIGATQQLRYVETPGRFDPCMDYQKGDRSFAL